MRRSLRIAVIKGATSMPIGNFEQSKFRDNYYFVLVLVPIPSATLEQRWLITLHLEHVRAGAADYEWSA